MELNNFNHIGPEPVVQNLMIHSVSPQARKLVEEMYTCNPYDIDIKLDKDSTNRVAEIVNTYLKAIGLRLVFAKVPKYRFKATIAPFVCRNNPIIQPFNIAPTEVEDKAKYLEELRKFEEKKAKDRKCIQPFIFDSSDIRRRYRQNEINKLAFKYKNLKARERYELYKKQQEEEGL